MKAVLLAGGKGTRLAPYTTVFPKPMMPIGEKPIMEILILQLKKYGFTEIILAVGYLSELMMSYFGDGSKWGVKIRYSKEESPLGTAGPLALIDGLTETFLVMNGDVLTTINFDDFIEFHKRQSGPVTVAVHDREVKIDYGIIEADPAGAIKGYIEKPTYAYAVSMGIYLFEPSVLRQLKKGEKTDLPDLIKSLIAAGQRVAAYKSADYWLDIGRPDDYQRAQAEYETIKDRIFNEQK